MPVSVPTCYAFNRTRGAYLATELSIADTHWTRLRGLMGVAPESFLAGRGLLIVPSHGVHTMAMRFPIDVLYLDRKQVVVHVEEGLRPWRLARISTRTASVLELPPNTLRSTGTGMGDEIQIASGTTTEVARA
jgi:uncharacterized protein